MLAFLRKVLKRDVTVKVSVSPSCVIRPGDVVLINLPYIALEQREELRSLMEPHLPAGSRALINVWEGASLVNLIRLAEQILDVRADRSADDRSPQPLRTNDQLAKGLADTAEQGCAPVGEFPGSRVLGVRDVPEPPLEPLPHSEASK